MSFSTFEPNFSLSHVILLIPIAHIGFPFILYRLFSLTPKIVVVSELDPLGLISTYPSENTTSNPFVLIIESERTLLLSSDTHSTFVTLNTPPESIQNHTILYPFTACLVPIPSSTCTSKSDFVKLSNNSRAPVMM
jgi:hypothetical protein